MNSTFRIQHLKVRLHVLSPIHIGCDDVYEPTSFIIDENEKKLIEFDPMDFIKVLQPNEREEFIRTCSGDNLLAIFKFIKRAYKPSKIMGREVEIANGLLEHYRKAVDNKSTYNNKEVINQFSISRTAYNPQSYQPYIPGSSLKGSMRTAYLSNLAKVQNIKGYQGKSTDLEKGLLQGTFATDPFRMVKVSDLLPTDNVKTKIIYAVNRKKKKSDKPTKAEGGPLQIFETIQSGGIFDGSINIEVPEKGAEIKSPISADNLKESISAFFNPLCESEIKTLKEIGIQIDIEKLINKSAFLVRLGRHSGAEAVTIEGNRRIKIMQGGGRSIESNSATTLWLASETSKPSNNNSLIPFGWAMLEILPEGCEPPPLPMLSRNASFRKNTDNISKKEVPVEAAHVKLPPETLIWDTAILTWNPGNQTLKAEKDGKRAEVKVTDRNIVPEGLHKKLFEKRVAATGNVEVAAVGNSFKIVKVF